MSLAAVARDLGPDRVGALRAERRIRLERGRRRRATAGRRALRSCSSVIRARRGPRPARRPWRSGSRCTSTCAATPPGSSCAATTTPRDRSSAAQLAVIAAPRLRGLIAAMHGHHQIEDFHYFPAFRRTEPRLAAGLRPSRARARELEPRRRGRARSARRAARGGRARSEPGAAATLATRRASAMSTPPRRSAEACCRHLDGRGELSSCRCSRARRDY